MNTRFLDDMAAELGRAEALNPKPFNSYHEAYSVILEELDEFWEIVRAKAGERNPTEARSELLQVATMAWRAARDLGLERLTP